MSLTWCVLALVLSGTDDSKLSEPQPPSPPFTFEIRINGHQAQEPACQQVSAATTAAPPTCAKPSDPSPRCAQADVLCCTPPAPLPRMTKPRTANDPQALEPWPMTLEQAIRIGLDNSEIVRVIAFGAQGIPVGGFVPTPLDTGIGAQFASALEFAAFQGGQGMTPPGQTPGRPVVPKANIAPIVIARLNADSAIWRFKSEVMAHVRSIEQQYWNLAQAHVQLSSSEQAVSMAQEILIKEQTGLAVGRGTIADVAEATQRLEQFNLDLVARTSDVITTERQLRNILGLPPSDNLRIIPTTKPTEQLVEYDWDSCVSEMMHEQPDVVQQEVFTRVAELQLLIARNRSLPRLDLEVLHQLNGLGQGLDMAEAGMMGATLQALKLVIAKEEPLAESVSHAAKDTSCTTCPIGFTIQMPKGTRNALSNARQAQYTLLRSRAYRRQVIHQTTHSLARFFLEIDANYKQYQTAQRLRAAAAERLGAQRAYYEEGRITVDRFMDAISQFTTAVATENQYLTTYNISLAALCEAKGTLLADRNIVVAEGPRPTKSWHAVIAQTDDQTNEFQRRLMALGYFRASNTQTDDQAKKTSFEPNKGEPAGSTSAEAKPSTWTFSISIGGAMPVHLNATYTPGGQPMPAKTAE